MRFLVCFWSVVCAVAAYAAISDDYAFMAWEDAIKCPVMMGVQRGRWKDKMLLLPSRSFFDRCLQMVVSRCEERVHSFGVENLRDADLLACMPEEVDVLAQYTCLKRRRVVHKRRCEGQPVGEALRKRNTLVIVEGVAHTMAQTAALLKDILSVHRDQPPRIFVGAAFLTIGCRDAQWVCLNGHQEVLYGRVFGSHHDRLAFQLTMLCLEDYYKTLTADAAEAFSRLWVKAAEAFALDAFLQHQGYQQYIHDQYLQYVEDEMVCACDMRLWPALEICCDSFSDIYSMEIYRSVYHPEKAVVFDHALLYNAITPSGCIIAPMLLFTTDIGSTLYSEPSFTHEVLMEVGQVPHRVVMEVPLYIVHNGQLKDEDMLVQCVYHNHWCAHSTMGLILPTLKQLLQVNPSLKDVGMDLQDVLTQLRDALTTQLKRLGKTVCMVWQDYDANVGRSFLCNAQGHTVQGGDKGLKPEALLDEFFGAKPVPYFRVYPHDSSLMTMR